MIYPSKQGDRILAVDDEPVILRFLSRVLAEEGYNIETTDSAEDALERMKNNRYRLIIMDMKMPGMSGIELYRYAQEIAPSLARRIVFITGDVMGEDTKQFLSDMNAHYLAKPIDIDQLKKLLHQILAGS